VSSCGQHLGLRAPEAIGLQCVYLCRLRVNPKLAHVTMVKTKPGATAARSGTRARAAVGSRPEVNQHVGIADPPDPEGSLRISTAVTGERPDEALSVVFADRPHEQVPAAPADPPSLGGKMPGQRSRGTCSIHG
jgi:hypothetical protein